ncbi:hypothetical protein BO94DRAFT_628964 [Aspergillus sclerotioniger CBS 115572]|uniref:Uncharacterized protein n=1 Tax=Aspergillus sclerotioniger CBS 115572 TaxID=1450535 RepID=A0A317UZK5_9EURO|nr:hypothetical protein BO94DRAFT_628964 [Aspergillus sclerotioniger CBS 115572]PWY67116.1 hypothetical protein BO94DRAFT_628964 [Aspergillus sclerotioniger CBS 115572]
MSLEMSTEEPVTYDIMADLPENHFGTSWTTPRALEALVYHITLAPGFVGQILQVDNLTPEGQNYIASGALPDQQSFVIDGTTAILRLVRWECYRAARHLVHEIFRQPCAAHAGMATTNGRFLSDFTFRGSVDSLKQPSRCYLAPHPITSTHVDQMWPSFVVETGVEGWLGMLRHDVDWWFQHSNGRTQTVMLLIVHPMLRNVYVESWQLGDMPRPTRVIDRYIHTVQFGEGHPLRFDTQRLMGFNLAECPAFTVEWDDLTDCAHRIFALS